MGFLQSSLYYLIAVYKILKIFFSTKTEPFPTHQYIFWLYQVTSALSYLRGNGITCKMLTLHSCLLDHQEKIKVADFWSESDESALHWWLPRKTLKIDNGLSQDLFMRRDAWRNISPEVLLGHPWTDQSFIWTFGLLFQQMLTHGKRPIRVRYFALIDFLNDDVICFPKDSAPLTLTNFFSKCMIQIIVQLLLKL